MKPKMKTKAPRCLRCGADSSWIEGRVPSEPTAASFPSAKIARLERAVIAAAMTFTLDFEKCDNIVGGKEPHTGDIETACARLELARRKGRKSK